MTHNVKLELQESKIFLTHNNWNEKTFKRMTAKELLALSYRRGMMCNSDKGKLKNALINHLVNIGME